MYARTRNLRAGYGGRTVIESFSRIMDDSPYVITGPNGGGKSTLFRVLSGVWKIRNMFVEGEVSIFEHNPLSGPNARIGVIFQEHFRYYLGDTPRGELRIHLMRSGMSVNKIDEIAKNWSLLDILDRPMKMLSDGEKLRVILAAIFSTDPIGFILDEPLSSLDPIWASKVARLIKSLDKPVLIFEHRREFFKKAHIAISNGCLVKPKPRKPIEIESRWDGKEIEIELFNKRQKVPLGIRGIIPIRGPNGGGKTTLLRKLFMKLSKGKRVAYMPSDPNLVLRGPKAEDEADRIYRGPIRRLSFGQRKELAVIATLSRPADIYLLDEPFKGLDDDARRRVLNVIVEKSRNSAIYIATNERESIFVRGPSLWIEGGVVYEESDSHGARIPDDLRP